MVINSGTEMRSRGPRPSTYLTSASPRLSAASRETTPAIVRGSLARRLAARSTASRAATCLPSLKAAWDSRSHSAAVTATAVIRIHLQRNWIVWLAGRAKKCGPFAGAASLALDFPVGSEIVFGGEAERSEEHTSELQSLMRSLYGVF